MTYQEYLALESRVLLLRKQVDDWFVAHSGPAPAKREALLIMLDARALASELLQIGLDEALAVQNLTKLASVSVGTPMQ